jgi:deoxyribonuclease I
MTIFLLLMLLTACAHTKVSTFQDAKTKLKTLVYHDHRRSFYCDEEFDSQLNVVSNRYFQPKKKSSRSHRIEWEHVVPVENFGRYFSEWRTGHPRCMKNGHPFKGRKCARLSSEQFRLMEADPYNLVPAIGEVNQLRSNFRYSELPGVKNTFGSCDFKVQDRRVEPRQFVKGDVARIYAYMEKTYGIKLISDAQSKLFQAWQKLDPIDEWECLRIQRIRRFHAENTDIWKQCR